MYVEDANDAGESAVLGALVPQNCGLPLAGATS